MDLLVALAPWAALAILLLVPPLVRSDEPPIAERWSVLERRSTGHDDGTKAEAAEATATTSGGRPMADGGRRCHNCGAYVDGDYMYCGECLMPKV
jgi:hypothetical protein